MGITNREVITNSDLDIDKVITITSKVMVIGSSGTERYFLPFNQFCYCDTVTIPYVQGGCSDDTIWCKQTVLCYIVTGDNEETFNIPEYTCVREGMLRTEEHQDIRELAYKHDVPNPKNWKETLLEVAGIETIEGLHVNGMETYLKDPDTGRTSEQEVLLKRLKDKGYHV